jgi:uncharacterized repeat protein (TIGR01451 family)
MRRKPLFVYAAVTALLGSLSVAVTATAAPSSTPTVSDFAQCANGAPPSTSLSCPSGWTNGILQGSNSHYHEDEVVPQRTMLSVPAAGTGTSHTISFSYLTRKDSAHAHAYDSLTTWNMTQKAADRCAGLPSKVSCPTGTASTAIIPEDDTAVTPGATPDTAVHERRCITDPTVCPDPGVMTMYGGTITNVSTPTHSHPVSGTGDDYATIVVTFTTATSSTTTNVQLLFGGHLAASNGPRGWGAGLGASNISGGPYHIRLDLVDGASAGGKDNQIQAGAILPLNPDFSITKSSNAPAGGVDPGATVTYTVVVTNTGQGPGSGSFTDTYQSGVTILSVPSGCTNDAAARTLTCTTGTLAPGDSQTFTYTAKMPSTFPDDTFKGQAPCTAAQFRVQNNATLASGGTATANVCVNAAPHFVPVKTNDAPAGGVAPGATVNYTVKITNDGSASGSTSYVDHYQSGVVITTVPAGCSDDGAGTLTCNTNVLAPGETQTFTYAAKMPTSFPDNSNVDTQHCTSTQQRVVNWVTVNGTTTTSNVCVNASAKFVPTKSVSPSTTVPGGTVTYTLTVTNIGTAPGVGTVTDVRQAGVTIVTDPLPSGCVNTNATTITCTSGTLAPDHSQSWTYQATMPTTFSGNTGGGNCSNTQYRFTNTATSDGTSVTAEVCVDTARFVISKTNNSGADGVAPGANVSYTVTVTNEGGAAGSTSFTDSYASGVVVNDATLPNGCADDVANRTITCSTGTIAANGGTQSFTYTAKMPTSFGDTSSQGQPPCGSDQFRVQNSAKLAGATTGTVSNVCVNAAAHFTAAKTASPTTANPGQVITYTVTVTNDGTAPSTDSFTDTPPAGVQIVTYPNSCSLTSGTLTCHTGVLAPNQSQSFVYTASMPTSYSGALGGSPCSPTQLKIVNHAVLSEGTTGTSTVCVNEPVLVVTKSSCTTNPVPANGQLSYTLTYSNTGSAAATNTVLTDTIPVGTTVANAGGGTPSVSNGRTTLSWTIGTLAAGGSGSKTFTVAVDPGNTSGQLVNSATITSTETSDTSNTVTNTVSNQGASASGRAYGVYANVLNALPVGPVPDATGNEAKSLISLNSSVLNLGVLNAANSRSVTATQASDTAVASVANVGVNLVGVTVHADAVVARSQSVASGSTATSVTNGSEVVGLTINGQHYGDISSPRVITVVNLLGIKIAEVYVLQQVDQSGAALGGAAGAQPQNGFFNSGIAVNGLRVRLLNGSADVVVSHAESKAQFPTGTPCSTSAPYVVGAATIADELLTYPTGPTVVRVNPLVLPSTGGTVSATINTLDLTPLAGSATGADSSHGTLSPQHVDSVADVEGATLLGSAITATTIKSTASASPGSLSGSTTIVNLKIGGLTISVLQNPPPNTVLLDVTRTLELVVNEQLVGSGNVITVNAIHLYVLGAGNPLGLPVGSDLVISGSTAGTG